MTDIDLILYRPLARCLCCPPLLCQVWSDEEGSVRSKTGSRRLEGKEKLELKINSASDWTKKEFQLKMLKQFNSQSQTYNLAVKEFYTYICIFYFANVFANIFLRILLIFLK